MHCRVKRDLIVMAAALVKTLSGSFIKSQPHDPASGSPADPANTADPSGDGQGFFSAGNAVVAHSRSLIPAVLKKQRTVILNPDSPENNTIGK